MGEGRRDRTRGPAAVVDNLDFADHLYARVPNSFFINFIKKEGKDWDDEPGQG
jgi:hypothetical protein